MAVLHTVAPDQTQANHMKSATCFAQGLTHLAIEGAGIQAFIERFLPESAMKSAAPETQEPAQSFHPGKKPDSRLQPVLSLFGFGS